MNNSVIIGNALKKHWKMISIAFGFCAILLVFLSFLPYIVKIRLGNDVYWSIDGNVYLVEYYKDRPDGLITVKTIGPEREVVANKKDVYIYNREKKSDLEPAFPGAFLLSLEECVGREIYFSVESGYNKEGIQTIKKLSKKCGDRLKIVSESGDVFVVKKDLVVDYETGKLLCEIMKE